MWLQRAIAGVDGVSGKRSVEAATSAWTAKVFIFVEGFGEIATSRPTKAAKKLDTESNASVA